VIPKDDFNKAIGKYRKYLSMTIYSKKIKAEKVPTAKTTKAINDFR
jgi:hypothetical protein